MQLAAPAEPNAINETIGVEKGPLGMSVREGHTTATGRTGTTQWTTGRSKMSSPNDLFMRAKAAADLLSQAATITRDKKMEIGVIIKKLIEKTKQ